MRTWIRPLLICVLIGFVPLPAWSIIIKTKDGKEYKGHLVQKDAFKVTIRPQGGGAEVSVFNTDIADIVQPVNLKQLEKLKPAEPKEYYEYALGLMSKCEDPEAQETALRLFLIAAYLEPVTHGFNSLMKMSEIARSGEEASSFRAMAFLLDVVSDKGTLKKGGGLLTEDAKARASFLKALALLRAGKTKDALKSAELQGVADYFAIIPGLMSHQDFVKLCKENPECTLCTEGRVLCSKCNGNGGYQVSGKGLTACPECKTKGFVLCKQCKGKPRQLKLPILQLQLILQLELLNESDPKAKLDAPAEVKSEKWSALLGSSQIRPIPVLSLIHLTEFDPRKCVFKDGKWIEP